MITLSWPFATWGIDILGPFPKAWGGYRFLIVAIDTFTKWVEAEPVGQITKENTFKFLWSIVMRFGVLHRILSDNGTQFTSKKFENFCERCAIKHYRTLVYHPRTNGQVKRSNGIILQGIKTHISNRLSTYDKKMGRRAPYSFFWWYALQLTRPRIKHHFSSCTRLKLPFAPKSD